MPDNFSGYLNQVPTFPVQDGTAGTLTNLIHASEINLWIVGPNPAPNMVQPPMPAGGLNRNAHQEFTPSNAL